MNPEIRTESVYEEHRSEFEQAQHDRCRGHVSIVHPCRNLPPLPESESVTAWLERRFANWSNDEFRP
jgi:hypothetical protein